MPFNYALLREIMDKDKIARPALAKLLNISTDYLYRLERGLKTDITLRLLERIADCTGYPPAAFISGGDDSDKFPTGRDKVPSVMELLSALDKERLTRRASDYKILEMEKRDEYHMAVIELVLSVNAILRQELVPSERAKKMAALARETAAAGVIQFGEIARIFGVSGPTLRRWLETHPIRYSCRMDDERYVIAVSPDEAAMRLVCFDCDSRNKKICGGFGRAYNPKNFDLCKWEQR
jgi:transcriptional regulator with XRE-family HTH domain